MEKVRIAVVQAWYICLRMLIDIIGKLSFQILGLLRVGFVLLKVVIVVVHLNHL